LSTTTVVFDASKKSTIYLDRLLSSHQNLEVGIHNFDDLWPERESDPLSGGAQSCGGSAITFEDPLDNHLTPGDSRYGAAGISRDTSVTDAHVIRLPSFRDSMLCGTMSIGTHGIGITQLGEFNETRIESSN
jgi:hypothetical protein